MDQWEGKVALVTGASSGIGAAIALSLARHGMKVVGMARRQEKVQELAKSLKPGVKGEIFAVRGDVTNEADLATVMAATKEKYGGVDVLVNNAGITTVGSIVDIDEATASDEAIHKVINLNVVAPVFLAREAVKSMKERNVPGHIINISSTAGHRVPNDLTLKFNVYSASKFFVTALSESLRQEFSSSKNSIKVTNLSPGLTRTEILDNFSNVSTKGLWKLLEPEDIAEAVIYVLGTPPHVNVSEVTISGVGE